MDGTGYLLAAGCLFCKKICKDTIRQAEVFVYAVLDSSICIVIYWRLFFWIFVWTCICATCRIQIFRFDHVYWGITVFCAGENFSWQELEREDHHQRGSWTYPIRALCHYTQPNLFRIFTCFRWLRTQWKPYKRLSWYFIFILWPADEDLQWGKVYEGSFSRKIS